MKKYIILGLILIGILQVYNSNIVNTSTTGHGLVDTTPTSNSIKSIVNEELSELHKMIYPKNKLAAFEYSLIDDIDSIEIYIGDRLVYTAMQIESHKGEFYILITEDNRVKVMNKVTKIIDQFNTNTVTTSIDTSFSGIFPNDREYHMEMYGSELNETEITYNQPIEILTFIRSYQTEESSESDIHYYDEYDASVKVVFIKK